MWWFLDPPLLRDVYPEEHLRQITSSARAKLGRPLPALFDRLRDREVVQVLDLHRTPKAAEWIASQDLPGGTTEILSRRRSGKGGYVYALELEAFPGLLKIGSAFEVEARMRSLSTGLPTDLKIVASVPFPDCRIAERKVHALLRRLRPDREWFQASKEEFLRAAAEVLRPGIEPLAPASQARRKGTLASV